MSQAVERCPQCASRLAERTNGMGLAYLECACGYVEQVVRKPDPFPTTYKTYGGKRRVASRAVPHDKRHGMYFGEKKPGGHGKGTTRVNRRRPTQRPRPKRVA